MVCGPNVHVRKHTHAHMCADKFSIEHKCGAPSGLPNKDLNINMLLFIENETNVIALTPNGKKCFLLP